VKRAVLWIGCVVFWLAWPAYQVYFRRSARTRVLLVADGQLLAVKGWINDGTWNLPGGGLHRAEAPLDGAIREVGEETGLILQSQALTPIGTAVYRKAGLHFTYHMFYGPADASIALKLQRHEIAELRWVPLADSHQLPLSQEVTACLQAARSARLLQ
jgi:8-oxo-dGTP pyrophosphatase MutT (NUDIX family)